MNRRRLSVEALEGRLLLAAAIAPEPSAEQGRWGQVIISLRDDVVNSHAAAQEVVGPLGGRLGHVYEHTIKGFSAQLPLPALAGIARHPLVALAEFDIQMKSFSQLLPTGINRIDAELSSVGGMIGTGKTIDVDIAIIDSGIANHNDLTIAGGRRFYTITGGPPHQRGAAQDSQYADDNGHGTHVAGIAAAKDNGSGVVGVAPGARLWAVKVLNSSGTGNMSDIIAGVDWVTGLKDADGKPTVEVANMSLGGVGKSDLLRAAIQRSVGSGIVYVVAAGNDWGDIHGADKTFGTSDDTIPAAYPEVATISALADSDGKPGGLGPDTSWGQYGRDDAWWGPSNFSNSGTYVNHQPVHPHFPNVVTSPGLGIDLVMPGADIYSTSLNGGYRSMSGTSMAAPHAAGLAALHIHANGRATDAAGVYTIRQTLIDKGKSWHGEQGLTHRWSPDNFAENLGWAGEMTAPITPAVSFITPSNDAVVAGAVTVTAALEAFGDDPEVEFFLNDIAIGRGTAMGAGEWTLIWDTLDSLGQPLYPDGSYVLRASASDAAGAAAMATINVDLDNIDDLPEIQITSPVDGSGVSGLVTLEASASDDRGVQSVDFFINGTLLGAAQPGAEHTWSLAWDTRSLIDGVYSISATVTDTDTQTATESIAVTINNSIRSMHPALSAAAITINRNFWRAEATVTVSDDAGTPLSGVAVTARWDQLDQVVTAVSNSAGQVTFATENLRIDSVDFRLQSLVLPGYQYDSTAVIRIAKSGATQLLASSTVHDAALEAYFLTSP